MAHLFISDGYPEADDCQQNYLYYDEHDPGSRAAAYEIVKRRLGPAAARALLRQAERLGG
jgi:hypothetical protein